MSFWGLEGGASPRPEAEVAARRPWHGRGARPGEVAAALKASTGKRRPRWCPALGGPEAG